MEKKLLVANWKMNGDLSSLTKFLKVFTNLDKKSLKLVDTVICPPSPLLSLMKPYIKEGYDIGAQDCHHENKGAFTGDISPDLVKKLGANYCIIGHSERRNYHNESNEIVYKKVEAVLKNNLIPIICVGETYNERESNIYEEVISTQISRCVPKYDVSEDKIIIAYEPIWSIGTGKVPNNDNISNVFEIIRNQLRKNKLLNDAERVKVLYGGSVNEKNCDELKHIPNLGGYLVGSASLKAENFFKIAKSLTEII